MDPQVEALLQMMAAQAQASGAPAFTELPAAEARAMMDAGFAAFNVGAPAIGGIADRIVPGPAGGIPVKVFTPVGDGPFPLLVYLHGGGWVIGSPETHLRLCSELALGSNAVVVSVHYRLAPEHPAPAALDDCVAAILWSVAHASELSADGTRFAIGGDSAGGNLTAAACLRLRDEGGPQAKLQLLLYGAYSNNLNTESAIANGEGKILTREAMVWFWGHYLSGGVDPADPSISPLNGDLHGLPPARLIVGTLDPLLDESKLFAKALEDADVPTTLSIYQDMPHVFLQLSGILDGGRKGVEEAAAALRQAFDGAGA